MSQPAIQHNMLEGLAPAQGITLPLLLSRERWIIWYRLPTNFGAVALGDLEDENSGQETILYFLCLCCAQQTGMHRMDCGSTA
jgi:hypothetical protein